MTIPSRRQVGLAQLSLVGTAPPDLVAIAAGAGVDMSWFSEAAGSGVAASCAATPVMAVPIKAADISPVRSVLRIIIALSLDLNA